MKRKKLDRNRPPIWGTMSPEEFEASVDHKSFPVCDCCDNPIYNPDFYNEDMCGPCTTGEAKTLMWHFEDLSDEDWAKY